MAFRIPGQASSHERRLAPTPVEAGPAAGEEVGITTESEIHKVVKSPIFPVGLVRDLRLWGIAAAIVWFVAFASGVLLPSCPHRLALDPTLKGCPGSIPPAGAQPVQDVNQGSAVGWLEVASASLLAASASSPQSGALDSNTTLRHLLLGALIYGPCNLALLALVSGFIGGCASRLTWADRRRQLDQASPDEGGVKQKAQPATEEETRMRLLRETPVASMLRGLVAYLLVLAGLLVISADPFKTTTPESYLRMAGLVSAVAFAVGYDPTRFLAFMNRLPSLDPKT